MKRFRSAATPRLSPDEASRQGRISRKAVEVLPGSAAVIAFLNTYRDDLGGRPLDLAIASDAGLAAMERALDDLTGA